MLAEEVAVLVCVTRQKTCERLIVEGARMAQELGAQLHVIHVAKVGDNLLGNPSESEALEYLYQISKDHGADMTMIRSNEVAATISAHARKVSAVAVVMGRMPRSRRMAFDVVDDVSARLSDVVIKTVYDEEK